MKKVITMTTVCLVFLVPLAAAIQCENYQTKCDDGLCISMVWLCDTEEDCLHGEDEAGCPTNCSGPNEVHCNNERCVSIGRRCDGYNDCGDNSDEIGCESFVCPNDSVKCPDTHLCVYVNRLCNKINDCTDNWDERPEMCSSTAPPCKDFETRCNNGTCISKIWECDTKSDCSDSEDEVDCPTDCSGPNQFRCNDSNCVPLEHRCNGIRNCDDNSDETGCETVDCQPGKYKCNDFSSCHYASQACDGKFDCKDESDELPSFCNDTNIPWNDKK